MSDLAGRVVRVRGSGRVDVAAYGIADAEHRVEKEIRLAWPNARVEILEIARGAASGRIVEEFTVSYRIRAELEVGVGSDARSLAFRVARERLEGTRYWGAEWEGEEGNSEW